MDCLRELWLTLGASTGNLNELFNDKTAPGLHRTEVPVDENPSGRAEYRSGCRGLPERAGP